MTTSLAATLLSLAGFAASAHAQLIIGAGSGQSLIEFQGDAAASKSFQAFPGFQGGVRVAAGDVDGDGTADVLATPYGGGATGGHVKVFSGKDSTELRSFFAFGGFQGGVSVAAGDIDGDGIADIVAAPDSPNAFNGHVKVFSGKDSSLLRSFFAFNGFQGGVHVAAGDLDGDGRDDLFTVAGPGGNGHVKVFSGSNGTQLASFFAFPGFSGGVRVAAGDLNGDGRADVITAAGPGGGPHVKVFDGKTGTELLSFFAYDAAFSGGVNVAVGDVTGDGLNDIITGAGPGGGPHIKVFDGQTGAERKALFGFAGVSSIDSAFVAAVPVPAPFGAFVLAASGVYAGRRRRV
jgi:hypothetical protein